VDPFATGSFFYKEIPTLDEMAKRAMEKTKGFDEKYGKPGQRFNRSATVDPTPTFTEPDGPGPSENIAMGPDLPPAGPGPAYPGWPVVPPRRTL
jgi:hypothetical protein